MKTSLIIKNALILFAITLVAGGLLGLTYNATADARENQAKLKTEVALNAVLSDSKFAEEDIAGSPAYITNLYAGNTAEDGSGDLTGYAFKLETTEGYGDLITMMVGLKADGTISGIDIISHTETPGLGAQADEDKFKDQFPGKAIESLTVVKGQGSNPQDIDAIGGATITSEAVTKAVNEAIDYYNSNLGKGAN